MRVPDRPPTRPGRRRRRSSSRRAPRPASRSRSRRWWPPCSSRSDPPTPTPSPLLGRHPDVHHDLGAARPPALHGPVRLTGRSPRRPTSGRGATYAAGATRIRPPLAAAETEMDPVKRAAHLHPDERPRGAERRRDPGALAGPGRGVSNKVRNTEQSPWESDFWNQPTGTARPERRDDPGMTVAAPSQRDPPTFATRPRRLGDAGGMTHG